MAASSVPYDEQVTPEKGLETSARAFPLPPPNSAAPLAIGAQVKQTSRWDQLLEAALADHRAHPSHISGVKRPRNESTQPIHASDGGEASKIKENTVKYRLPTSKIRLFIQGSYFPTIEGGLKGLADTLESANIRVYNHVDGKVTHIIVAESWVAYEPNQQWINSQQACGKKIVRESELNAFFADRLKTSAAKRRRKSDSNSNTEALPLAEEHTHTADTEQRTGNAMIVGAGSDNATVVGAVPAPGKEMMAVRTGAPVSSQVLVLPRPVRVPTRLHTASTTANAPLPSTPPPPPPPPPSIQPHVIDRQNYNVGPTESVEAATIQPSPNKQQPAANVVPAPWLQLRFSLSALPTHTSRLRQPASVPEPQEQPVAPKVSKLPKVSKKRKAARKQGAKPRGFHCSILEEKPPVLVAQASEGITFRSVQAAPTEGSATTSKPHVVTLSVPWMPGQEANSPPLAFLRAFMAGLTDKPGWIALTTFLQTRVLPGFSAQFITWVEQHGGTDNTGSPLTSLLRFIHALDLWQDIGFSHLHLQMLRWCFDQVNNKLVRVNTAMAGIYNTVLQELHHENTVGAHYASTSVPTAMLV